MSLSRWLQLRAQTFLALWVSFLLAGCLPQKVSRLLGLGEELTITGRVVDTSDQPVSDVLIFVEKNREAITTTAGDGTFTAKLSESALLKLKGNTDNARDVFYLYVQKDLPEPRVGVSPYIEIQTRGQRHVGDIRLVTPAKLEGKVMLMPRGKNGEPANGARVRIGRYETLTKPDGTFLLDMTPSGKVPLSISANEFAPNRTEIDIQPAGVTSLPAPLYLFPPQGVSGALYPSPIIIDSSMIQQGHPFVRTFFAMASQSAAYIRMHHDKNLLEKEGRWFPLREKFDYDFPKQGGHNLYYQFTDAAQKNNSPIYQLGVALDLFADSTGVTIDDGSGFSYAPEVILNIDVPAAAFRMRVAESPEGLLTRPWRTVSSQVFHRFDPITSIAGMAVEHTYLRTVNVQFVDATGLESVVFSARTQLILMQSDGFRVDTGNGYAFKRMLDLTVDVPSTARQMRMWDDLTANPANAPWLSAVPAVQYLLTPKLDPSNGQLSVSGPRKVFLQFRDAAGWESEVHERSVYVDLWPINPATVFTINNGAPTSNLQIVNLQVNVPPNAREMRIFEPGDKIIQAFRALQNEVFVVSLGGLGTQFQGFDRSNIWLSVAQAASYNFYFAGSKVLFLQFRDADLVVSPVYQQSILVNEDITSQPYGFLINGGSAVTTNQLVNISLVAPPDAVDFTIFEGNNPPSTPNYLALPSPTHNLNFCLSAGSGSKIIEVVFRNIEKQTLSGIQSTIIYNPPDTDPQLCGPAPQ